MARGNNPACLDPLLLPGPKEHTPAQSLAARCNAPNLPEIHLPVNEPVSIRVVAGDAFSDTVAHVGTDRGVFRGSAACGNCSWNWKPYNEGLPLAIVNDLIVVPATGELRAATRGRGVWTTVTGP